jgi:hypothetical protein
MRLSRAPWWVWSVVLGTVFGAYEVISNLIEGRRVVPALIGGLVGGAVFGALMGPFQARQSRRNLETFGSIPRADRRTVARAALRGPLPTDPELREATRRYARSVVDRNTPARRAWTAAVCLGFVVLSIAVSSQGQWWFLLVGVLFGGLGIVGALTQTRIRRRLTMLEGGA